MTGYFDYGYFDYGYFNSLFFDTQQETVIDDRKAVFGRSSGGAKAIGATRGEPATVTGRTR